MVKWYLTAFSDNVPELYYVNLLIIIYNNNYNLINLFNELLF